MPKKISFKKIDENHYEYVTKPRVNESNYYSHLSLPIDIGRKLKGKNLRVTIEVIEDGDLS